MSAGMWIFYMACGALGLLLGTYINHDTFTKFKWWLVWKMEPWFEERASLDLAWRVFARKHNTAGNRPICAYKGWEADLDPKEKAAVYEFPGGDPSAPPDCLVKAHQHGEEQRLLMKRKTAGLETEDADV